MGVDTVPFVGRSTIKNYDFVLTIGTPQLPTFSLNGFVLLGRDENFAEWAPGWRWTEMGASWRPTERAFRFSDLERRADGFFVKLSYLFRS